MHYTLNPHIALRSWWRTPFAYYIKGVRDAQRLTKEEFEFLSLCDGKNELEDGELAKTLVFSMKLIIVMEYLSNRKQENKNGSY